MKYRVLNMPVNAEGYKMGDTVEYDPEVAALLLKKGYIEPLDMDEARQDKQLRTYHKKEYK